METGKGNVSINSLEAAARALNITIIELLQDAPRPAMGRIQTLLVRLDDTQLDHAYAFWQAALGGATSRAGQSESR